MIVVIYVTRFLYIMNKNKVNPTIIYFLEAKNEDFLGFPSHKKGIRLFI